MAIVCLGVAGVINPRFLEMFNWNPWDLKKTLVLVGPSGIGKTTWAKKNAPKPCLFVSHLDDLKSFRADMHKSIMFDDVSVTHMPITSQIHLCDMENVRSIHVRYGTVTIPAGVPKIFTCNSSPIALEHPAIARRCQFINCNEWDLS